ncbi:MAG: hypothetical protein AB7R40_23225 [Nitrospiraceae bacterium]
MTPPWKQYGPRDYHTYCGPAAIARILGVTRETAASILLLIRTKTGRARRGGETTYKEMLLALKFMGAVPPRRRWKFYNAPAKERPTLRQWLKAHPNVRALVTASNHAIYVDGGRIIEDNGRPALKGRMQGVLRL